MYANEKNTAKQVGDDYSRTFNGNYSILYEEPFSIVWDS